MTKQNINELINYIREKYKDPESAIKVLVDYKEDYIPSRWEEIKSLVFSASTSTKLDVLLDQALEEKIFWKTAI